MLHRSASNAGRGALLAAAKSALQRSYRGLADFAGRVWHKAGDDDIFFLAGGISFNFLLAAIPFLLLLVSAFGYLLQANLEDPESAAVEYVLRILPASPRVVEFTREAVAQLIGQRTGIGIVGILLLVWVSTRLIGSLRSALRAVFDIREDRGIIAGMFFVAKLVVVSGSLFVANTAITSALEAVQTYGMELLGLTESGEVRVLQTLYAQLLAYGFIFLMFVL